MSGARILIVKTSSMGDIVHALPLVSDRMDLFVGNEGGPNHLFRNRGDGTFEDVAARALELNAEFEKAFQQTKLPDRPDFERVNAFLVSARRRAMSGEPGPQGPRVV